MEKSTIEVAIELMEKKKTPQPISKFLKEVSEIVGADFNDADFLAQLYIDITTSARFIFCGDDLWDLKERHVDLWDKDGSFFNDKDMPIEDEDDGITVDDYNLDDEEIEEDEIEDDDSFIEQTDEDDEEVDELDIVSYDEEIDSDVEEDSFDEDTYGKVMDDYEKYYDE